MAKRYSFVDIEKGGMRLKIRTEYVETLLKIGIEDPGKMMRMGNAKLLHDDRRSTVASFPLLNSDIGKRVVLKQYKYPDLSRRIKDLFRPSKATRELRITNALLEIGIRTPAPLAIGECRKWRLLQKSFLITEEIVNSVTLRSYLAFFAPPLSEEKIREKRDFISCLAKEIKGIHGQGFFHGDLNIGHILVQNDGRGDILFCLLDFEHARLVKRISARQIIDDLSSLNIQAPAFITRTDRLRFFKEYIKDNKVLESNARRYLKRIQMRTLRKLG